MDDVTPLLIDVESDLDGELTLASLARRYGSSPFHFHRFFSKAVGETPKRHVERLRLERAAYKLAVTDESILDIALAVGFKNHETFSRAFKRAFRHAPREYRRACKAAQGEWSGRHRGFRGNGCVLSDACFVSLPAMTLLAVRHHGAYAELPVPFLDGDGLWNDLVDRAKQREIRHRPVAILICYDDPTLTPERLQRCDACIPVVGGEAAMRGRIRQIRFAGGRYGGITHAGALETIEQAYWTVADRIRYSGKYTFAGGPPVQIYRHIHVGGDPSANVTEVYFPVRPAR